MEAAFPLRVHCVALETIMFVQQLSKYAMRLYAMTFSHLSSGWMHGWCETTMVAPCHY